MAEGTTVTITPSYTELRDKQQKVWVRLWDDGRGNKLSLCPNLSVAENTRIFHKSLRGWGWRRGSGRCCARAGRTRVRRRGGRRRGELLHGG